MFFSVFRVCRRQSNPLFSKLKVFSKSRSPRLPADEHEIVLHNDGTWDPLEAKQEEFVPLAAPGPSGTSQSQRVDTFAVVDSDSDEPGEEKSEKSEAAIGSGSGKVRARDSGLRDSGEEEAEGDFVITLDSDSEEEPVSLSLPLKKRARIEPEEGESPGSPELICLDDD